LAGTKKPVRTRLLPPAATLLQTFGEFLDPIAHVHFNVEGTIEFTSMLFIPGMAPFEQQNWSAKSRSIKLYVRRVFISDEFDEDLMPRWVCYFCYSGMLLCYVMLKTRWNACAKLPMLHLGVV
jgi:hypothetical protein